MSKEIFKAVEIDGRSFSIRKFDAKTGLQIARLILTKLSGLMPSLMGGEDLSGDKMYGLLFDALANITDTDLDSLVNKCLRVCYENLAAGRAPVMHDTGHYGVEDVEFDMILTIKLCVEAIMWGAADFFGENSSRLQALIPSGISKLQPQT